MDNIQLNLPAPPIDNLTLDVTNSIRRAQFSSQTGWTYWLERSANLTDWSQSAGPTSGTSSTLSLSDNTTGPSSLFYRVRAERQ